MDIGDKQVIHSYKHDGSLHRIWTHARVVDCFDGGVVLANHRTKVIESDGRYWYTREPSVDWFFKERWFNVIAMLRRKGVYYYCNLASPYVVDEEALKYIDYDLDVKVFPDFSYKVLDRGEFERHVQKMGYSEDLKRILENELEQLTAMVERREGPFQPHKAKQLYDFFRKEGWHERP